MPAWEDEGLLLNLHPHGERSLLADIFTLGHGKCRGMVLPSKGSGGMNLGSTLHVRWQARLEDHLGSFKLESTHEVASFVLSDKHGLRLLSSVCGLLKGVLPERHLYTRLYQETVAYLKRLKTAPADLSSYIEFEMIFLQELGFGLDLTRCAVTGEASSLTWVSPKTGRAVCYEVGLPYKEKLLPLPAFLHKKTEPQGQDLLQAFHLTGYFIKKHFEELPFYSGWTKTRSFLRGIAA